MFFLLLLLVYKYYWCNISQHHSRSEQQIYEMSSTNTCQTAVTEQLLHSIMHQIAIEDHIAESDALHEVTQWNTYEKQFAIMLAEHDIQVLLEHFHWIDSMEAE